MSSSRGSSVSTAMLVSPPPHPADWPPAPPPISMDLEGLWLAHSSPFLFHPDTSSLFSVHNFSCLCLHFIPSCIRSGVVILQKYSTFKNVQLFCCVMKDSIIKQLLSRRNLVFQARPPYSSFSCLLVSLLLLPDPHRTHKTAPALQTRMDDFTVLPGFPL